MEILTYFRNLTRKGINWHPDDSGDALAEELGIEEAREYDDMLLRAFNVYGDDFYKLADDMRADYIGGDKRRAALAHAALDVHSLLVGDKSEPMRDRIVDLIANLLHLAEDVGAVAPEDIAGLADIAATHFREETHNQNAK